MSRRRQDHEHPDSIPLRPLGRSSGVAGGRPPTPTRGEQREDPLADEPGDGWTWDTFPLVDVLAATWEGFVNPPADRDAEEQTWDVRRYADPSRALWVVLLLGVLFWIFPQVTLPALGWTWRHTLGYPFQSSLSSTNVSLSNSNFSVPTCTPLPLSSYKMPWQKEFSLPSHRKGVHLVTRDVEAQIAEGLRGTQIGLLHLFIKHTSASLALGENWDSEVRSDMDRAMDHIVPESGSIPWDHIDEGLDDSVSHTKNALFGSSIQIPITNGRLNLGTWQGIYLAEFRRISHTRRVVATIIP